MDHAEGAQYMQTEVTEGKALGKGFEDEVNSRPSKMLPEYIGGVFRESSHSRQWISARWVYQRKDL